MVEYREISSLCQALGYSARTLYSVSNAVEKHYHEAELIKSNGEIRLIRVPDKLLKSIQRRIVDVILLQEPISDYAMAYKTGSSTSKNASPHVGKRKVLKLDIRKFFDYITYPMVKERVFTADKFSEPIRILLSILCIYFHQLPQGAPTSPAISNIIMRTFDEVVGDWCSEKSIAYSRYCDDMTFSGDFDEKEIIAFVDDELRKNGFFLNHKKTVCLHDGQRKEVTGIVVNEKISVPANYKKKIRQEMYYINRYGLESHIARIDNNQSVDKYVAGLLGRVNYVILVEPHNEEMIRYRNMLISLKRSED